ncbi:hypothetical protein O1611_g1055 [Lasiodiplodia mahajangana]|uniref:Uncharacterized protein n=1 Tax=Lasiodiplodia mahajangana TaxID=1108764 RepID=A0ACC2JYL8_9PEZI|nr:hypothetical protein O1611_g1055 [Lasiodiplodia mahajangana]
MGVVFPSVKIDLVAVLLAIAFYLGRRAILPKPLVGIPYNRDAANKMFGDVPEMVGYIMREKRIFCWLTSLTARHQSPIVQAFIKPGSLPWVIVTDPFETQDILLRRREFDRSGIFGDLIGGILPEMHIQFQSSDMRFKNNRNLINHLMTPTFINNVSAPDVYSSICTLIKVWQAKCDTAKGRPFSAHHDLAYAAVDSIFASSFRLPEEESITIKRLEAVLQWKPQIPSSVDEPVNFPESSIPEIFAAILTLGDSLTNTQLSPAPVFTSWVLQKFPYMKKAKTIKDKYIRNKSEELRYLSHGDDLGGEIAGRQPLRSG